MSRAWGRLVLACMVLVAAAFAVAGGSAGNRTADVSLEAFPGPPRVTYEENLATTARIENTGASTFTHVELRQKIPVATFGGTTYPATLVKATCDAVVVGDEIRCTFGRLPAHESQTATTVWRMPTIPSPTGCTGCAVTSADWIIKEGKPTNENEAFPTNSVAVSLLGGEGTQERLEAGSFEISGCADPFGAGSLRTNRSVSLVDPVSTTICLPTFTALGHTTTITEFQGDARSSAVCVAASGQSCAPGYVPANFAPSVTTIVFRVAAAALGHHGITQVRHNGIVLTPATCAASQECLLSITLDHTAGVWMIVVSSPTNGLYDW